MKSFTFFYFIIFLTIGYGCKKKRPVPKSSVKEIVSFSFRAIENSGLSASFSGVISNDSIIVKVVKGTQVTSLIPVIYFTGEKISPSDKAAQDFTNPVQYTVTAADGSFRKYIVIVSFLSAEKSITSFILKARESAGITVDVHGIISNDTISVAVPPEADITKLVPTITYTGVSLNPGNKTQTDFTYPVVYTVAAEDGTSKAYTVFISANTLVFAGSSDGRLYAINAATGGQKWQVITSGQVATPAYRNGVVFAGSTNEYFYAVNASTGNVKWKYYKWPGSYSVPVIQNGIAYFTLNRSGIFGHFLYALNEETGSLIWEKTIGSNVGYGSLSGPTVSNGLVYTCDFNSGLCVFDAATGDFKWSYGGGVMMNNPAVVNGIVYTGTEISVITALDAVTGQFKWHYRGGSYNTLSSPTVVDGVIYSGGGLDMYAFNNDGSLNWKYQSLGSLYGIGNNIYSTRGNFSSPVIYNGVLYAGNNDNIFYAINAANGSLNWNYNNMLQINTYAPAPAAANGVVYVCRENDSKLYAFHAGTGNIKWIFPGNGRMNTSVCIIDSKGTVFNSGDSGDQN